MRAGCVVGVFFLAAVVSYTDRLVLSALIEPIKSSLGVGDSAVSLLQGAAFAAVYVVAGLWLGRAADQHNRVTILIAGSTVWCVGTMACGLAPSYETLFLARIIVGIGEAALAPAAVSIISDIFPAERRGSAISAFMLGFVIGGPASISIGSFLLAAAGREEFASVPFISQLAPWRMVLVLLGLGGLIVPVLLMWVREPARGVPVSPRSLAPLLKSLGRNGQQLLPLYGALALLAIGDYALLSWMSAVLSRRFLLAPDRVGTLFGLTTAFAAALGCLLGGPGSDLMARRYDLAGRFRWAGWAAALASICVAGVAAENLWLSLFGLGSWSLFSTMGSIGGVAALQGLLPDEMRGIGIALMAFMNTLLGLGLGPTLVAVLTDHAYRSDIAVGYSIISVAIPAGGLASIMLMRARPR